MPARSTPDPLTLFLAIFSLCLSLICFAISLTLIPRIIPIRFGWLGFLFLLFPAHLVAKYFRAYRLRRRIRLARQRGLILCLSCGFQSTSSTPLLPSRATPPHPLAPVLRGEGQGEGPSPCATATSAAGVNAMLRLIRKTLFILSLLLALATAALWIRSYWWFDQAMWRRESLRADHRGYFTLALFAETARDRIKIGLVSKNIELREGDLVSGSYHHRLLSGPDSGCIFQTDSISLEPNLKQYLDVEMKGFAGFNVDYGARTFKSGQSFSHRAHWADLTLPLWLPTFLFLMPVLFQIRRGLKHRFRRRRGLCSTCGYDIRANFDVCPECGAETVQPPSSAA